MKSSTAAPPGRKMEKKERDSFFSVSPGARKRKRKKEKEV